jgi:hypothetical protein
MNSCAPSPLYSPNALLGSCPASTYVTLLYTSKLFSELLQIHEETGAVITDAFLMAIQTASLHHHNILSILLVQRDQTPDLFPNEEPFGTDDLFIQALLGASLPIADIMPFSRRLLHGSATRIAKGRYNKTSSE